MLCNLLYFVVGIIYNVIVFAIELIPMSIDVGSLCIRHQRFPWEFDDIEFVELLEEEAMRDD